MTIPNFAVVEDLPENYFLFSSDDSGERENFESIFGVELPYVQADYQNLFIFESGNGTTTVYGVTGTPYNDSTIDLLYHAESGNPEIYHPYFGSHLQSTQQWAQEDHSYDSGYWVGGFYPFNGWLIGQTYVGEKRIVLKLGDLSLFRDVAHLRHESRRLTQQLAENPDALPDSIRFLKNRLALLQEAIKHAHRLGIR